MPNHDVDLCQVSRGQSLVVLWSYVDTLSGLCKQQVIEAVFGEQWISTDEVERRNEEPASDEDTPVVTLTLRGMKRKEKGKKTDLKKNSSKVPYRLAVQRASYRSVKYS